MSDSVPQTLQNHVRYDPFFHFFLAPVFVFAWVWSIVHVVRHPSIHAAGLVVFLLAVVILMFKMRLYALKVQTRVIRLEERLRLQTLLAEPLRSRIPELTESQLVALRFASDGECAGLVQQALTNKMSNKEIKAAIRQWRGDYWRV